MIKCAEWKVSLKTSCYSVYGNPYGKSYYPNKFCLSVLQKEIWHYKGCYRLKLTLPSSFIMFHVTERNKMLFSKLKFGSDFQKLSPGGALSFVEVPNLQDIIEAVY